MKFKIAENSNIFMGIWITSSGGLTMEKQSVINANCHLDTRGGIYIGSNVSISPKVSIITADHDIQDPKFTGRTKRVIIENNVFVGFSAIILPGVTLGRGCVVCSGAVVTKNVEPLAIVAGVPAVKIGERKDDFDVNITYSRLFG